MARRGSRTVTCPWCGHYYEKRPKSGDCDNCGGPLPAPSGDDRGLGPPPPPRTIPAAYRRRIQLNGNVFTILGIVFTPIGVTSLIANVILMATVKHFPTFAFLPLGLTFTCIGVPMLMTGLRRAKEKLAALERGIGAEAEVTSVELNTSVRINNRSPWVITYRFSAGSADVEGSAETFKAVESDHKRGDKIWVVYLPENASVSTVWPPIG